MPEGVHEDPNRLVLIWGDMRNRGVTDFPFPPADYADLKRQTADAPFVLGCPGSLLARWFIPRLDRLNRELPLNVPFEVEVTATLE